MGHRLETQVSGTCQSAQAMIETPFVTADLCNDAGILSSTTMFAQRSWINEVLILSQGLIEQKTRCDAK